MGPRLAVSVTLALGLWLPTAAYSQEKYHDPAPVITRILDVPSTPLVVVSPDHSRLLILERSVLPSIAEVAGPELRLAGIRLNPRTNAESRAELFTSLVVQPVQGEVRRIVIPWQSRVGHVMWSPDSRSVAFTLVETTGVSLWVAEASTGDIRLLLGPVLNAAFGNPCRWLPSGSGLLCSRIPADRSAPPADTEAPVGPIVRDSRISRAPQPTGEDLLQNPGDDALFDHYSTSQLVIVPLSGPVRPIGQQGVHLSAAGSPDGKYLLVQSLHGPWPHAVGWRGFPRRTVVWDMNGQLVREIVDRGPGAGDAVSGDSVPSGPRDVAWRADAPATLVWFEAKGDGPGDRVLLLAAPFTSTASPLVEVGYRGAQVTWSRPTMAIVTERWARTRRSRVWAVDPSHPEGAPRLLLDRTTGDPEADPGRLLTVAGPSSDSLLHTSKDGRFAFLAGAAPSPEGDRPFLDRLELASGRLLRLFQSEGPASEVPVAMLDPEAGRILSRREGGNEPPNYFVRDLRKQPAAQLTQVTRFTDHAPEFAGGLKERISYTGPDGVERWATVYLPPRAKGPLPFLFWATSPSAAVSGVAYQFSRPSAASPLFLLLEGYGVVEWPAVSVRGKSEILAGNARAVVDRLVGMGLADRGRIAVGGESDGALVAAELMSRPNLFRAGIALELPGAPADSIRGPLLVVRGLGKSGSDAARQQTERSMAAITGSGDIRLVLLPGEAGSPRARESVGQVLYEMAGWMARYVKP